MKREAEKYIVYLAIFIVTLITIKMTGRYFFHIDMQALSNVEQFKITLLMFIAGHCAAIGTKSQE